jgi:dTDP-4-dehydrorhamnose reductase
VTVARTISRVLVTGASGQLAASVVRAFADREVIAHTRATLDVTDGDAVQRETAKSRPDLIVNCAAFNQVDAAESHPTEAFAVNALAVRSLARAAESCGAALVHYGSDFVFDGTATDPYDESAAPAPHSVYASSKLVGEWLALEPPRAYVLRVESLFGSPAEWTGRRGTLDAIVAGLEAGREVTVFTDRTVSPSYVVDVASATRYLVETGAAPGTYHCVNSGYGTWQHVALEAARILGVTPRLTPITMADMPLAAARPRFCALSNRKLAAAGFAMPAWQDALRRWLAARGRPAA